VVYRAYDPELDRQIALKVVRTPDSDPQRVLAEAQALARVSHPNVIAVHDVGTHDGSVFVAMELVEGRTLTQWRRRSKPTRQEIVEVFIAAGRGLAAAHAAAIVHRDFKPSNVMVGDDGRVRVLDFGVARATSSDPDDDATPQGSPLNIQLTQAGTLVGTPSYMAPEQARDGQATPACDQFSFCVALYEALWGRKPFPPKGRGDMRMYICDRRAVDPPSGRRTPTRLRRAVMRGLSPEAAARFPSMDALIAELDAVGARKRQRRRALAAAATIAAAAAITCGSAAWRRHSEASAARARESSAMSRLDAMEVRVAELMAGGRVADADSAFLAFARLDEHRGTDALALAWLHRAEQLRAQGRHDEEVVAWATAWGSERRKQRASR